MSQVILSWDEVTDYKWKVPEAKASSSRLSETYFHSCTNKEEEGDEWLKITIEESANTQLAIPSAAPLVKKLIFIDL